jgi:hypothetical protein
MIENTDVIQATSKERKTKEITVGDMVSILESRLTMAFAKIEKIEKYLSELHIPEPTPSPDPKPKPKSKTTTKKETE